MLMVAMVSHVACDDGRDPEANRDRTASVCKGQKESTLLPVALNWRHGYVDANGDVRIPLQYKRALEFRDARAVVRKDSGYGVIDSDGDFVLNPIYRAISPAVSGQYFCHSESGWNLVDVGTQKQVPIEGTTSIRPIRPGTSLAAFRVGGKWGYLGPTGKVVIPPRFDRASWFEGRLARVVEKGRWGLINEQGEYVVEPTLDHIDPVEPIAGWRWRFYRVRENGKYGFLRPDGRWLLRPQFENASQLGTKWIAVRKSKDWMFVDEAGRVKLRMDDTDVPNGVPCHAFSEGLAAVRRPDGALVWVDMNGTVQIGPKEGFLPFPFQSNGVAVIWLNDVTDDVADRSALVSKSGEYVVGSLEGVIKPFPIYGELVRVNGAGEHKGLQTYVDPKGRFLWLPEGHPWAERTD
jgi:hypothetical protein